MSRPAHSPAGGAAPAPGVRARRGDAPIRYRIVPVDPHAHLFEVVLTIADPDPAGQRVALPAWIPGSYMIREFARHIVSIAARDERRAVRLRKLDKHGWQAARCAGPLEIRYTVYAWDLSVRAAHLDATHGFFNGTSVFLRVLGQDDRPCEVWIEPPAGAAYADWRVATTLPEAGAPRYGFGRYRAADYDELVDHPVEMGRFALASFEAGGARHEIALTGRHDTDLERLCRDLARICAEQARLFEPRTRRAPIDRYLFLVTAVGDGYGGLEHRASTALICARDTLPWRGLGEANEGYRGLLGLASHEYFHTWNVKRIKPAAFARYDLQQENYTRLLWIFEGFTSYYDDLMLARSGVIGRQAYLDLLAKTIGGVLRGPGRRVQNVAESSFDAWIKYYRQDENSPNAIASYYAKGSLVALALDLAIRSRTGGRRSLDDAMRLMWRRYGRDFFVRREGLAEEEFPRLLEAATGLRLDAEIRRWAYGTAELPLESLLAAVGVKLTLGPGEQGPVSLGARISMRDGRPTIATAYAGQAAQRAGLSAGDALVAIDGLRVDDGTLKTLLARRRPGERVRIHAFRRDELFECVCELDAPPAVEAVLTARPPAGSAAARLLARWLGPLNRTAPPAPRPGRARA